MLLDICDDLRDAFVTAGYDADTVLDVLGADAHAALGRGEPVPARRAARGAGALGTLIRLFLLADPVPESEAAQAFRALRVDDARAAGLLERDGDEVRTALDVRPLDVGAGNRWIISDLDGSLRPRPIGVDHVLGVGHASLSLLRATPTAPVARVLDLGTGCGIQAVHASGYADHVVGTDVNERALRLAAATAQLNSLTLDLRHGSWFEPVAGAEFDQIVANPPFVVGAGRVEHTYRDSGLHLDGASELVVSTVPRHLAPGGTAALLASWLHTSGDDWRRRVAAWLPDTGVDAWIVQRDVAEPALYVGTWLRDAGLDPRTPVAQQRAEQWLDDLAAADVDGIGFGFVFLRRIDGPTQVLAEDLTHGFDDPLGAEVPGYFTRSAWLRDHDVLDGRLTLDPATALERVSLPGETGWREVVVRLHRGDGPAWQHEADDLTARLVGALSSGVLTVADAAQLLDVDAAAAAAVVEALIRHGLVVPV